MTTPQNILSRLDYHINRVLGIIEGSEDDQGDIRDVLKQIQLETSDLMSSQQRLENQMNLIRKLLSKPDH